MSQRITEILEVLRVIRNGYSPAMRDGALLELRQNAVERVAEIHGIDCTTV